MNFLIDHNLKGQAALLWGTLAAEGWLEIVPVRFVSFDVKRKNNDELKSDSIQVLNEFKKILGNLIGEIPSTPELASERFVEVIKEAARQSTDESYESVKNSDDMNLKLRNASSILLGMATAFHPSTEIVVLAGFYEILEIDVEHEPPEITLKDVSNELPVIIDLEEQDIQLLKSEKVKEGDIIQARIRSDVNNLGQTAAWRFLNLRKM
jgi:hypothetical protein